MSKSSCLTPVPLYTVIMLKKSLVIISTILVAILAGYMLPVFADFSLPWSSDSIIGDKSIGMGDLSNGTPEGAQNFWFKILGLLKVVVSGFALIYLVIMGVYMVVFSDVEDKIKTQRKQITYAMVGFIFLNIPGMVWTIFRPDEAKSSIDATVTWSNISGGSVFWSTYGFDGLTGDIIGFLRVFAYGAAILTFTWGLLRLTMSGGDDEKQKIAKHRLTYGILGLIFLGFVEGWSRLVAFGDFTKTIPSVANKILGLALFFAAPVAIFMIIWWAYYYITSAWDEERAKKGKTIVVNTFIATIILLAAMSFLTDLVKFTL